MTHKDYGLKKKTAIFFASLAATAIFSKDAGLGKLEEFLKGFPTKIPGVSQINKYHIEGAKHVIIHFRQNPL